MYEQGSGNRGSLGSNPQILDPLNPFSMMEELQMILRNLEHPGVKATRYQAHGGGVAIPGTSKR